MSMVARPPGASPPRGSRTGDEPAIDGLGPSSGSSPGRCSRSRAGADAPTGVGAGCSPGPAPRCADSVPTETVWDDISRGGDRRGPPAARAHPITPRPDRLLRTGGVPRSSDLIDETAVLGPVRIAYAVRWLELGDGDAMPSWHLGISGKGRGRGSWRSHGAVLLGGPGGIGRDGGPPRLLPLSVPSSRSGRLVVHPLDGLGGVLGGVDRVLHLAVEVAPFDDLDRVGTVTEEPAMAARDNVSAWCSRSWTSTRCASRPLSPSSLRSASTSSVGLVLEDRRRAGGLRRWAA